MLYIYEALFDIFILSPPKKTILLFSSRDTAKVLEGKLFKIFSSIFGIIFSQWGLTSVNFVFSKQKFFLLNIESNKYKYSPI